MTGVYDIAPQNSITVTLEVLNGETLLSRRALRMVAAEFGHIVRLGDLKRQHRMVKPQLAFGPGVLGGVV